MEFHISQNELFLARKFHICQNPYISKCRFFLCFRKNSLYVKISGFFGRLRRFCKGSTLRLFYYFKIPYMSKSLEISWSRKFHICQIPYISKCCDFQKCGFCKGSTLCVFHFCKGSTLCVFSHPYMSKFWEISSFSNLHIWIYIFENPDLRWFFGKQKYIRI